MREKNQLKNGKLSVMLRQCGSKITIVTLMLQLFYTFPKPLIFDFYSVILCSSKTTAVTTRYVTVILQITFLVD